MILLEVQNLSVSFERENTTPFEAVKNVSFNVGEGEIVGIVGESGSGKSVTALSVLGLLPYPRAFHSKESSILFNGKEIIKAKENQLRKIRGKEVGFIFQEPMSSLNPLHKIGQQIEEVLQLHRKLSDKQVQKEVVRLLELTGIPLPELKKDAYPFELSGGQRQRVMIAMAIANNPKLLIADEPTTALDVTIQAQIIDLLMNLRKKMNMAIRHAYLLAQYEGNYLARMRKHAMWYVAGLPGASVYRRAFNDAVTFEDFKHIFCEAADYAEKMQES